MRTDSKILVVVEVYNSNANAGDNTRGNTNNTLVYQDIWNASNNARYTWIDMSPNSGTISNVGETGVVYAYNSTYHLKSDNCTFIT